MTNIMTWPKVEVGKVRVDGIPMDRAIEHLLQVAKKAAGGYVVTPNVDHIVQAQRDQHLSRIYQESVLSLPDGAPIAWIARWLTGKNIDKVSGADLIAPLCRGASERGQSIYLLGGAPGIAQKAAVHLGEMFPALTIVGTDSPPLGFDENPDLLSETLERIRVTRPDFVFVALGCPKQEYFMHKHYRTLAPAVLLGIGASLDFLAGKVRRAPAWMSQAGLEWSYRLMQEPRRLANRYLWRDLAIFPILWSTFRSARLRAGSSRYVET